MRSFFYLPALLLAATSVVACSSDEKPKPDPSAATSASGASSAKGRLNLRTPMAPQVKVDPQATKEYRVDVCYFGTMTLRQARDTYLASLGGAEPSEKKIPSFGGQAPAPGASGTPAASGAPSAKPATPPVMTAAPSAKPATPPVATAAPSAKPAASGAPSAKPAMSGAPAAPGASAATALAPDMPGRRPFDIAIRAPHERNARACTVAAGLKDAAMGDVDGALQAYSPFAADLAKNVATAMTYYQREEYKKDSFEKGKQLHKQLVEGFQKLDEMSDKLGTALDAWHKAHPRDAAKMEEGEKLSIAAYGDARDLMLAASAKKPNVAGFKEAMGRLEKSLEALKTYAQSHGTDPWGKIMNPSLESMLKAAKEADSKVTEKGVDGDTFLTLTNSFVNVIESKYRALSRSTTVKAQPMPSTAPAAPSGAPEAPKPE